MTAVLTPTTANQRLFDKVTALTCLHGEAFLKIASPVHHLVGISDVIHRRILAARKLFAVLVGQHLQLELLTLRAALAA